MGTGNNIAGRNAPRSQARWRKKTLCKPTLNDIVNFEEWRRCDCVCQCTVLLVRGVTPMPDILLWYRVNKKIKKRYSSLTSATVTTSTIFEKASSHARVT